MKITDITAAPVRLASDRARLASDLLPVGDIACLLLAAVLVSAVERAGWIGSAANAEAARLLGPIPWVAIGLAPFLLYDSRFGERARNGDRGAQVRSHALRWTAFAIVVWAFGAFTPALRAATTSWLGAWLAASLLLTSALRLLATWAAVTGTVRDAEPGPRQSTEEVEAGFPRLVHSVPMQMLADRPIRRGNAALKIAEDLLLGSLLTLLLLPLLGLIALAIKLDSPGPVIFRQRRHGLDNAEFDIFKFRSMTWVPPGQVRALEQTTRGDARITRLGRFLRASSIDELPQLFNVLAGDMSLVGPRPHAIDMRTEDRLGAEITDAYAHRHRVKPGITGWAQVNGARGATDTTDQLQRRVLLDIDYIEHWSLLLDLKILLLTARVVLQRTNAF